MWKRPKRKDGIPLRVVGDAQTKSQVLQEFQNTFGQGTEGFGPPIIRLRSAIGGKVCIKMQRVL